MALIPVNVFDVSTDQGLPLVIDEVELTGDDTIASKRGRLYVRNDSANPATLNILGDESTGEVFCKGVGLVDVSGGFDLTVAAGETVEFNLNDIGQFLRGEVAVTGGTADMFAFIRA